ncbi:signal transducing kinase of the PAK [Ceratobasidium sp. 414]|nr:signal transducing kinase of the PAK [Ceratobasidium sp. 414]
MSASPARTSILDPPTHNGPRPPLDLNTLDYYPIKFSPEDIVVHGIGLEDMADLSPPGGPAPTSHPPPKPAVQILPAAPPPPRYSRASTVTLTDYPAPDPYYDEPDATTPSPILFDRSTATKGKKSRFSFINRFLHKTPEISTPYDPVHLTHVRFNSSTGEFTGLPTEWPQLLSDSGISLLEQERNPEAVMEVMKFYQETRGAATSGGVRPLAVVNGMPPPERRPGLHDEPNLRPPPQPLAKHNPPPGGWPLGTPAPAPSAPRPAPPAPRSQSQPAPPPPLPKLRGPRFISQPDVRPAGSPPEPIQAHPGPVQADPAPAPAYPGFHARPDADSDDSDDEDKFGENQGRRGTSAYPAFPGRPGPALIYPAFHTSPAPFQAYPAPAPAYPAPIVRANPAPERADTKAAPPKPTFASLAKHAGVEHGVTRQSLHVSNAEITSLMVCSSNYAW